MANDARNLDSTTPTGGFETVDPGIEVEEEIYDAAF
jgi:hypothetical protein